VKKDNPVKLVQTFGDHKGLFFPFYQIFEVAGWTENESKDLIEYLQNHILQEKYMWHLDWQDGDINVAEQILTIHKRWAFEAMDRRILWRIASGHENL
jgi:alpha-ketoglutarate-dependent taurine dioxygenase